MSQKKKALSLSAIVSLVTLFSVLGLLIVASFTYVTTAQIMNVVRLLGWTYTFALLVLHFQGFKDAYQYFFTEGKK